MTDRITSHVKVSIGRRTLLFDDDFVELHAFEDELKHLDEKAPELIKVRSITLMHSLCHIDCIKEKKHSSSSFQSFASGVTVGKDVGSIIDWSAAISSLTNIFNNIFYAFTNTAVNLSNKTCLWQKPQKHEKRV